jgi:hypothetical protein
MAVAIPLGCVLVAGLIAFFLARAAHGWAVWVLILISGLVFVWAWAMAVNASGWDGIGYVIMAFLMALPVLLGCVVGGALAVWRRRRGTNRRGDHENPV